jgi:hypothetical protein
MEHRLYLGDLVTPVCCKLAFQEKHGFGVITEILTTNTVSGNVVTYEVKFVKSLQAFRFSYDAVRRYGQD